MVMPEAMMGFGTPLLSIRIASGYFASSQAGLAPEGCGKESYKFRSDKGH